MKILSLTDAAVIHIKKMIEKRGKGIGFRLTLKKTGCSGFSYVPTIIDEITETDFHFVAQEGLHIYIDPTYQAFLKDIVIDYAEEEHAGLKQKRLLFLNPHEKNRCGCGESFTIE